MIDRTTKALLLVITLALWGLLVGPLIRLRPVVDVNAHRALPVQVLQVQGPVAVQGVPLALFPLEVKVVRQ